MKTAYKVVLINLLIAVVVTAFTLLANGTTTGADVALYFGLVCLALSAINLFVGLVLALTGNRRLGNGMVLSFAVLLLLSGISCSQGFKL